MCLLGMGRVQAGLATADAIRRWHPRYILLVGIAGGMAIRSVKVGDILISDQIVDYESQKITSKGPEVRWDVSRADPRLLDAYNNFRSESWQELIRTKRPRQGKPNQHKGPIASGDKVIAFGEILAKYCDIWPKLIGVEMEAAGVATAAFQSTDKPGFFMVRGVSDLADENKGSTNVEKWRLYACDVAASFTIALLKSGPIPLLRVEAKGAKSDQQIIKPEPTDQEWLLRCEEGKFEPISFDTPEADGAYGYKPAPTGKKFFGKEQIPFNLVRDTVFTGQGHRIIEVHPHHPKDEIAKSIRPAEVKNATSIYVLLSAGDTRRTRGGEKFDGKEIGYLIICFYTDEEPQTVSLRLGIEVREWVSGEEGLDVVKEAIEAEQVWISEDKRHTIDMIRVNIEGGPKDVSELVVVGTCSTWLSEDYKDALPSIRISGVTYKTKPSTKDKIAPIHTNKHFTDEVQENFALFTTYWEAANRYIHPTTTPYAKVCKILEIVLPVWKVEAWEEQKLAGPRASSDNEIQKAKTFYDALNDFSNIYSRIRELEKEQVDNRRAGLADDGGGQVLGVHYPSKLEKNAPMFWENLEQLAKKITSQGKLLK